MRLTDLNQGLKMTQCRRAPSIFKLLIAFASLCVLNGGNSLADCKSKVITQKAQASCEITTDSKSFILPIANPELCLGYCGLSEKDKYENYVLKRIVKVHSECSRQPLSPLGLKRLQTLSQPIELLLQAHGIRDKGLVNQARAADLLSQTLRTYTQQKLQATHEASKLEKINQAFSFFFKKDPDSKKTPLERISTIFSASMPSPEQDPTRAHRYLRKLTERLFDQQVENPLHFVSHGVDHSLNVVDSMRDLSAKNPAIVDAVKNKYRVDETEAKLILEILALSHDLGYPGVGASEKPIHGPIGADYLKEVQGDFLEFIHTPSARRDAIAQDLLTSVHNHSADKIDESFPVKLITKDHQVVLTQVADLETIINIRDLAVESVEHHGLDAEQLKEVRRIFSTQPNLKLTSVQTAFQGRKAVIHPEHPGHPEHAEEDAEGPHHHHSQPDPHFGLQYSEADLLTHPLEASIRLTDNMDVLPSRMTPLQRSPAFRAVYHLLGNGPDTAAINYLEAVKSARPEEVGSGVNWKKEFKKQFPTTLPEDALTRVKHPDEARKFLVERVIHTALNRPEHATLAESVKQEIREAATRLRPIELFHFGGTESLQSITLRVRDGIPEILIVVNETQYNELNRVRTNEKTSRGDTESVGVGAYQIWRAREALSTLRYGGKPLTLKIISTQGNGVPLSANRERSPAG